jgi:hypothetical protein
MRKRRTRAHIIEDLGFNHVERQVLLAGYTVERIRYDYGHDGYIQTFNDNGEIEPGSILMQLKSTDKIKLSEKKENSIIFDLSIRDLELWLSGREMMLLLIHDAQLERTFFVELKDYFRQNREALQNVHKFVRIFIPFKNVFNHTILKKIRATKNLGNGNNYNV